MAINHRKREQEQEEGETKEELFKQQEGKRLDARLAAITEETRKNTKITEEIMQRLANMEAMEETIKLLGEQLLKKHNS